MCSICKLKGVKEFEGKLTFRQRGKQQNGFDLSTDGKSNCPINRTQGINWLKI